MTTTRIAIAGGPLCGKSTTATRLGTELGITNIRRTDSLLNHGHSWSEISLLVADWLDQPGPWIIEGTRTSYALEQWLRRNPGQPPPVDEVLFLTQPRKPWTPGQAHMARSIGTVHGRIDGWLRTAAAAARRRPPESSPG